MQLNTDKKTIVVTLRMSLKIRKLIEEAALQNGRTFPKEVEYRLKRTLVTDLLKD